MEWIHHLYLEYTEVGRDPAVSAFYIFIMAPWLLICIFQISMQRGFLLSESVCCKVPLWHLYYSGWSLYVGKSLIIKGGHKHLMVLHEYFRALVPYRNDLWKTTTLKKAHLRQITSRANSRPLFPSFGFFVAWLDWFVICNRKELGHGAVDNPIYRFAIY